MRTAEQSREALRELSVSSASRLAIICALIFVLAGLDAARIVLLVPILDALSGGQEQSVTGSFVLGMLPEGSGNRPVLGLLIALYLLAACLRSLCAYVRDVRTARWQGDVANQKRSELLQAIGASPWSKLSKLDHGRVMQTIEADAQTIGTLIELLVQILSSAMTVLVQLVVALILAPLFALLVIAGLMIAIPLTVPQYRRFARLGTRYREASESRLKSSSRFLSSLKTAVAEDVQDAFIATFRRSQAHASDILLEFARRKSMRTAIVTSGIAFALAAVVFVGSGLMGIRTAILLTLIYLFARLIAPLSQLVSASQNLTFAMPSIRAFDDLLAEIGNRSPSFVGPVPALPSGNIVLADATYLHESGRGVIEANLKLSPGEFVGLSGPSGQGKTTLIDLLAGLLPPQRGTLTVGGTPIVRDPLVKAWRQQLAYVTQDGLLMNLSIRRNLVWGDQKFSDDVLLAVLERVGAGPLLARLAGLDTSLGERGALISGGERQRIAIARALLRKPSLLLLDEATNMVDTDSEADLLERLARLDRRPTIVLVTHRAETLRHCDRVLEMHDGRLLG